jgi:hypothetical protein
MKARTLTTGRVETQTAKEWAQTQRTTLAEVDAGRVASAWTT